MHVQQATTGQNSSNETEVTDGEAAALARATVNLFKAWRLTDAEACKILGGLPACAWTRWQKGEHGEIDSSLRATMSHLMGIHMGLRRLFKEPQRGYAWVRVPNAAFGGQSALQLMIGDEIAGGIVVVLEWLEAERCPW